MEFENAISVNARRRRRAPESMSSSTCALTFSTPASARTVGGLSPGALRRVASMRVATVFVGSKLSETLHASTALDCESDVSGLSDQMAEPRVVGATRAGSGHDPIFPTLARGASPKR